MPIYMDRHDLDESINAEHVATIHQEDLKIEHEFGCKGLTYWFDDQRKTAFCLIKAPNKAALKEMHNKAHGAIPHSIIEVDPNVVESFLGRIEDPVKAGKEQLNVIIDPAFRVLLVVDVFALRLDSINLETYRNKLKNCYSTLQETVKKYNGRVVRGSQCSYLCSFRSVAEAKDCSFDIRSAFESISLPSDLMYMKIGLSSGVPIASGEEIFEETIKLAERLCQVVSGQIVVSSDIKELFENEHIHITNDSVRYVNPSDEKFLHALMDFMDDSWNRANLKVHDFCSVLGLSKSQLYRKIKSMTGKSLNTFIREFRMQKALTLLDRQQGNISEIAFDTGFNSPAYFSKCFFETFGTLPSDYIRRV